MEILDALLSLVALIVLEIILGIDNLVFLSILTEKLPKAQRKLARRWGLSFAWISRLVLLASAVWLARMTAPLFTINDWHFSVRDIFLLLGGAFLIAKATQEIHFEVDQDMRAEREEKNTFPKFWYVVSQVAVMDIIFSLDSVLTAIGLTSNFWIMALAISIAIFVMIYASEPVSLFIEANPTIKMLALSFLILIGMVLVADSFSFHVPRGYVYFAMGFSLGVEFLNLVKKSRRKRSSQK